MNNIIIPADLYKSLDHNSLQYVVAGELRKGKSIDELIKRFADSATGTQIPGRAKDASEVVAVLKEMKHRQA